MVPKYDRITGKEIPGEQEKERDIPPGEEYDEENGPIALNDMKKITMDRFRYDGARRQNGNADRCMRSVQDPSLLRCVCAQANDGEGALW